MDRARRFLSLTGLVTLVVGPCVSCGGQDKFELTLRNRDDLSDPPTSCYFWIDETHAETTTECESTTVERRWVASDGRQATSPGRTGPVYFSSFLTDPVECNGQRPPGNYYWFKWSVSGGYLEVQFEEGAAVALHDEHGMAVWDGVEIICSEATGQWVGTAGELKDRAGIYTMVYDSIQAVLHLVED